MSFRRSTLNGSAIDEDERISLGRADHRKADARIAARCLDDRLAGFQRSGLLCRLDDAEREAILHRAERIERLHLDEQIDAGRSQAIDADDRRVADRFQDTAVGFCHQDTSLD